MAKFPLAGKGREAGFEPEIGLREAENPEMLHLWQARQGSNLRPQVLETCALPTELRAYKMERKTVRMKNQLLAHRSSVRSGGGSYAPTKAGKI